MLKQRRGSLPMLKQRRGSAVFTVQLISAFVFATWIVQFLFLSEISTEKFFMTESLKEMSCIRVDRRPALLQRVYMQALELSPLVLFDSLIFITKTCPCNKQRFS